MRAFPEPVDCDKRITFRQDDLNAYFEELSTWLDQTRAPEEQDWAAQCFQLMSEALERFVGSSEFDFLQDTECDAQDSDPEPCLADTVDVSCLISLDDWIGGVRQLATLSDIYELLEKFQKKEWTDVQRSTMSKAYMAQIERLKVLKSRADDLGAISVSDSTKSGSNNSQRKLSKRQLTQLAVERSRQIKAQRLESVKNAWWNKD